MSTYFVFNIQISRRMWEKLQLHETLTFPRATDQASTIFMMRQVAARFNRLPERSGRPLPAGHLHLYGIMIKTFRYLLDRYTEELQPRFLEKALDAAGFGLFSSELKAAATCFAELFPGREIVTGLESAAGFIAADSAAAGRKKRVVKEMFLLSLAGENQALDHFREILDDTELEANSAYRKIAAAVDQSLADGPPLPPFGLSLSELLRAPLKASPRSLAGQVAYIREKWGELLPPELLADLLVALDIVKEEERLFQGGPGRPRVLEFLKGRMGYEYPDYERFSLDADWMGNVVMIAKMVYVWLGQLARKYGRQIDRLDQVPDEELDLLARRGFTALWLIGLWERSPASARLKQLSGNPEAAASAYSLYDYIIAHDLGGAAALDNLKERCMARGIRLASDMVPNHTGIYSRWTVDHPEWFIQLDYPPYPAYNFTGPDLSSSSEISIHIEDGYWEKRDAAVVFKHYDHRNGRTRYIYHGNDGTSTPWNDTAQLNYLLPEVRESVIRTILHVAHQFPIIRFDAAMTLAKKHYQRLWYPQPGFGSGIPSRAEHGMTREEFDHAFPEEFWREVVDRVAAEAPDTLLLAEAFWLMEGYFVRTLGMHRVYNSAFMNMLKMEENAKYRQTVKNVIEYDPRILRRFVNFMNNPDERTAVEQFGKEGKYFGACVLLVTMPGLPMIGHGQIEGFHEKYGMEYRRAYWDEPEDGQLVAGHEARIFPLMRRRHLFSGSENFVFYDFFKGGQVDENVFAYSNRAGGERALILYHNCYASTSGWIRTSTAISGKNDRGESILIQKTLGEALCINPGGEYYYAFRDYSCGQEYLSSGLDLCSDGLYAELGAYEFKAFLDFREICDDEFGSWGKLCADLHGRGVASIDDELKRIRYGAVIEAFKVAVEAALPLLTAPAGNGDKERLLTLIERFYGEVNRHTGCEGDCLALAEEALREFAALQRLKSLDEQEKATWKRVLPVTMSDRLLLAAFLISHGSGKLSTAEEYSLVSVSWYGELGLERAFADAFWETSDESFHQRVSALLLRVILRWQHFFYGWEQNAARDRFTLLFADQSTREFLECHAYAEHEWFSMERFEMLLHWLFTVEALGLAVNKEHEQFVNGIASLRKAFHDLQQIAATAGFQEDRFLEMLETGCLGDKV